MIVCGCVHPPIEAQYVLFLPFSGGIKITDGVSEAA